MTEGEVATALLEARSNGSRLPCASTLVEGFDLDAAYRVAAAIERRRIDAGERPRGWKIGFTNRSIWQRYNVHQPIWGRVWDSTLVLLEGTDVEVSLAAYAQPRIEPEIVLGLKAAPHADMSVDELVGCLDWVAHGIEIVDTHCADWRFEHAADTVADFGLHGRLLVGPRLAPWPTLARDLAALTMVLSRDGCEVDRGHGALVLDGPLTALQLWLRAMQAQSPAWNAGAGEVVTTGTLTDAWPLAAGEHWRTGPGDQRLPPLDLRCVP